MHFFVVVVVAVIPRESSVFGLFSRYTRWNQKWELHGWMSEDKTPALKSLSLTSLWNLTSADLHNQSELTLAEWHLTALRGRLGWDTGSIWQTEMQIINYSYSLPPSSASSVEFLNIWQRQQNPPQSSFSPLSMKTDKKKAALLWSVFPSILLRRIKPLQYTSRSHTQPLFNLRWPLHSSDPALLRRNAARWRF